MAFLLNRAEVAAAGKAAAAQWCGRRDVRTLSWSDSCPNSGKKLEFAVAVTQDGQMDRELVARVAASTGLSPGEATRVVADVLGWYREPLEAFVRRRHAHFRRLGNKNDEIFAIIAAELADRLVAAPALSARQLRRIVYG